jgi:hypothetical protein
MLLGSSAVVAQKDYIIKLSGDTVYGDIIADNYDRVNFKASNGTEGMKFKANEILGYYKNKKNATYHRVNRSLEKDRFSLLPAIVQGKINLYEYVVQSGMYTANVSYFASKNGKDFFEIKNNSFYGVFGRSERQKDALYELLKDNEAISQKYITENKTSIKNLIKIIEEYNFSMAAVK